MAQTQNTCTVSTASFQEQVLESDQPVLVDFWAEWCGPCRMLGPTIDALAAAYQGRARVVKVNVDDNPEIARQYGVRSIPTVMLFHAGEVQETFIGVRPQQDYQRGLDALVQA